MTKYPLLYFDEERNAYRCSIIRELGLSDIEHDGQMIRERLSSLTDEELVELGKKYIPGQNAQGALTMLIKEVFRRVKTATQDTDQLM